MSKKTPGWSRALKALDSEKSKPRHSPGWASCPAPTDALAVSDGRVLIGHVVEIAGRGRAIDPDGVLIGEFATCLQASRALPLVAAARSERGAVR